MLAYEQGNVKYTVPSLELASEDIEIGIEIEIERIRAHTVTVYPIWEVKNDGSLRDHGFEYVSVPIKGKRIVFALNQFFGTVNHGYRFSPRTSIHVHMNVLDLKCEQIGSLLTLYMVFERLFYKFIGGDRDKNNFCVPMLDCVGPGVASIISQFLQPKIQLQNLEHHRYMGVNVDAVRKFGSLEFRHLGGTDNKARILTWINLIFCLKKFVQDKTWDQVYERLCMLNTTSAYYALFNDVFGKFGVALDASQLQNDMEYAVSRAKRVKADTSYFDGRLVWLGGEGMVWAMKQKERSAKPPVFVFNPPARPNRNRPERAGGEVRGGLLDRWEVAEGVDYADPQPQGMNPEEVVARIQQQELALQQRHMANVRVHPDNEE